MFANDYFLNYPNSQENSKIVAFGWIYWASQVIIGQSSDENSKKFKE